MLGGQLVGIGDVDRLGWISVHLTASSFVFELFLPPTTIIASTSAASFTESSWRVRVTGQTVLTTRMSWHRRRQNAANSRA